MKNEMMVTRWHLTVLVLCHIDMEIHYMQRLECASFRLHYL